MSFGQWPTSIRSVLFEVGEGLRVIEMKTTMRYHYTPFRVAEVEK